MQATCLYASKPCTNPRSLKPNGEPHRLCAAHRAKANDAQRRWHSRQRHAPTDEGYIASTKSSRKRRRAPASPASSDCSSESDVAEFPPRQRRRQDVTPDVIAFAETALATPTDLLMPPMDFGFLPMLQQLDHMEPTQDSFSDEDLAQLGGFLFGLDDCKLQTPELTYYTPAEATIYCL